MTPERWQRVKEMFDSASELEAQERVAFLDRECVGDNELRAELESLLESDDGEDSFMESPAIEDVAADLFGDEEKPQPGQKIGRYEIAALAGEGGMGEVYLARDNKLRRSVALKILPAAFTADADRLHRFEREAFAASSLNHPNILTVYEFGAEDGHHFIATEFINGESLRQYLKNQRLDLREVLDIGIQVASALSAAHAANIVHRDIKPENVMVRRDGIIKVLDFGLAKLVEQQKPDSQAPTEAAYNTLPGTVMGTVSYMSPEQARGKDVDARTDIWSLGVVLYEMLAGHLPFAGETMVDTLGSILSKEPPPLSQPETRIPDELERIVAKTLRKDKEERYQSAKDLALDLKSLKRRLEFEAELERTGTPNASGTKPAKAKSKWIMLAAAFAGVCLTVLATIYVAQNRLTESSSSTVSVSNTTASADERAPVREMRYWIEVQKTRGGQNPDAVFESSGREVFEKGYQIRLNFRAEDDGYFYLFNEGKENYNILYPIPVSGKNSAETRRGTIVKTEWNTFDDKAGTEKFWLIWTKDEQEVLKNAAGEAFGRGGKVIDAKKATALRNFLDENGKQKLNTEIEKDDSKRRTILSAEGDKIVYLLELEHL
jgi:serine/threonine protein kinase